MSTAPSIAPFDVYSAQYDDALNRGLALVGETKEYFARGRLHVLARRLAQLDVSPAKLLDYGCGIGDTTPHFFDILGVHEVVGVDLSAASIQRARTAFGSAQVHFCTTHEFAADGSFDLVFTNGTFHHIPPAERPNVLALLFQSLRPGGWLAFWENNPWNLGTRWVMSRVPFDRDAQMLWPREARRLISCAGLDVVVTDFAFVFPRWLRFFRRFERRLCPLPLGGQYLILARKPGLPRLRRALSF
jgi:SAM-dependent methyltransferase